MKITDICIILSTLLGPIIAVSLTIWFDYKRKDREGKMTLVRLLMTTKHLPADPNYSAIINLIPVEFYKSEAVMTAYNRYVEQVKYRPTNENIETHSTEIIAKQTRLIYEVLKCTGFEIPESKIMTNAYASEGFISRDKLYQD